MVASGLVERTSVSQYRLASHLTLAGIIYAALLMLLLSASRASFRLVGEFVNRRRTIGRRCIVYGTSGATLSTIRDAFGTTTALRIVGFVDDDPLQRRSRVQGYPVVGGFSELLSIVDSGETDCVVVNKSVLPVERLQALETACRDRSRVLSQLVPQARADPVDLGGKAVDDPGLHGRLGRPPDERARPLDVHFREPGGA